MKTVLLSNAISSFFSRHDLYFHPAKDCRSTRPYSPFFYIYCYFGQIFCTEVIQFFSVENLGHKELKKSSKYKLVIFLDEKQRFTFAIFLPLFIQGASLTHTASERNIWCWGDSFHRVRLSMMHINCWIEHEGIWLTQSHLLYTNRVARCQIKNCDSDSDCHRNHVASRPPRPRPSQS